jgi:hypothetical protein
MANIRSAVPNFGDPGDKFTVSLDGDTFTDTVSVSFGVGIDVIRFTVISDGELEVKIRIDESAVPGPRDIVVTDPPNDDTLAAGFTVR